MKINHRINTLRYHDDAFTLIELLAVIVILAIILVIAVPQILGVIEQSKRDSLSSSAILLAKTVEQNVMLSDTKPTTIDCLNSTYGINSTDYKTCTALVSYGDNDVIVSVDVVGKGKFNGLTVWATKSISHVVDDTNTQNLKTVLLATVNSKDVDVNKYNGNGLYKWGSKYIYRGGITKINTNGLATGDYLTDTDSGSEVNNYIKVPWETYVVGEDCKSATNKCYRIISINSDGNITIVRDKNISDQVYDNTHNTAASNYYSQPSTHYGYNDLLANTPTTGHPEEYRALSNMYTYLYGTTGYENTTIKPYSPILQPLNICLNKVNDYAGVNNTTYATTTKVIDTCNITGKPNTTAVAPLQNKYVRLPYTEEYLNATTEATCTQDAQYECRNQNYLYNKVYYFSLNGYSSNSCIVRVMSVGGSASPNNYACYSLGVRPVIILKYSTLITGGTGTQTSPYVIKW